MEKYGLLEEHEMDSIIADSNEKTVASDVASSATAGAAAAGCAVAVHLQHSSIMYGTELSLKQGGWC